MKKHILNFWTVILISVVSIQAQEVNITYPPNLQPPYEVEAGVEIEVTWYYFDAPPTFFFSYSEDPVLNEFFPDDNWTTHTDFTDNGDGTYSLKYLIEEEVYIWAGQHQPFLGRWTYSNILHITVSSGVKVQYDRLLLCPEENDSTVLSVQDTFDTYQWYKDNEEIDGATSDSYSADSEGQYKVLVSLNGEQLYSNTVTVEILELSISGSYDSEEGILTITTDQDFDEYQWLSGESPDSLIILPGENDGLIEVSLSGEDKYYAVQVTSGNCTLQSEAKLVSAANFAIPILTMRADTNSYGVVCDGTEIKISTEDIYGGYEWYVDGAQAYNYSPTMFITNSYQTGTYKLMANPIGWPEINLESEEIEIAYFEVIQPVLSGVNTSDNFCPGEQITIVLGDEGYEYTWYMYHGFNYDTSDVIQVNNNTLEFEFQDEVAITVEAQYKGCTSTRTIRLSSYSSLNLGTELDDYNNQYLCTDSTAVLSVSSYYLDDFTDFQWYQIVSGDTIAIDGESNRTLIITEPGIYFVQGTVIDCPTIRISSYVQQIYSFSERDLFLYADNMELCEDSTVTLHVSGGVNWQDFQWYKDEISMGQHGYEKNLVPIVGADTEAEQEVSEFNAYAVKARFKACPTGPKITSNKVQIKPQLNPDIIVNNGHEVHKWHLALYDSIPNYLFCSEEMVNLSLAENHESIAWFSAPYTGDGGYQLGEKIGDGDSITVEAAGASWYTAKVKKDACVGYSTPVLIDTKVYQNPAVASYNNAEICSPGDSTLVHIAFYHNYSKIEWYRDGILIPDSNRDSIWAKEPGEYIVVGYPEDCPDHGYSSGMGPFVTFLEAWIEENDSLIYAMPELGEYTYQWYKDGEPIEGDPLPWILRKENLEPGVYTVEVTNPEPCTAISDEYHWNPTSVQSSQLENITAFPNPTSDRLTLIGLEDARVVKVELFNSLGQYVKRFNDISLMDISDCDSGFYYLRVETEDNQFIIQKIIIQRP